MSTLQWLRRKYPALEYFDIEAVVRVGQLEELAGEEGVQEWAKTQEGRKHMKRVRQFASYAENKLKNGRKLYKFLAQQHDLTQIIMNNQRLKGLDAFEGRHLHQLTELQLSNNQISNLQPLASLSAPQLEELDLSSNTISSLTPLNCCNWARLGTLFLQQNRIVSIEGVALGRLSGLKELNLSDNFLIRVRYLRKELNGNLPALRKVNLSHNYITDLPSLAECAFVQMASLDLTGNPASQQFSIEKVSMGKGECLSRYEIRVSTLRSYDKLLIFRYREKSRHKLALKVEAIRPRLNRQTLQKGRKLILD